MMHMCQFCSVVQFMKAMQCCADLAKMHARTHMLCAEGGSISMNDGAFWLCSKPSRVGSLQNLQLTDDAHTIPGHHLSRLPQNRRIDMEKKEPCRIELPENTQPARLKNLVFRTPVGNKPECLVFKERFMSARHGCGGQAGCPWGRW